MVFLSWIARALFLRRLLGRPGRSSAVRRRPGSLLISSSRHRHARRGGFGLLGPVPTYTRRTRGGGRVSVGGCCLPIPLALVLGSVGALRLVLTR
ncbi:MAG: hypothetical protein JWO90_266 [Solirubrobacterales bacterium]|jgi:hypothetical protein|nr:hypothetical protein [Solirubrobacterales bacterium]